MIHCDGEFFTRVRIYSRIFIVDRSSTMPMTLYFNVCNFFVCFQSKDVLELKILELVPDLTLLGETFEEASELEIAHNHVMKQLQV